MTTDDHGIYEVRGLDAGFVPRRLLRQPAATSCPSSGTTGSTFDAADNLELAPEQVATDIDAELALRGAVTGKVTTAKEGWTVNGVNVTVYRRRPATGCTSTTRATDWSGVYLVNRLDPGAYRVRFEKWDRAPGWFDWIYPLAPEFYSDAPTIRDADDVTRRRPIA